MHAIDGEPAWIIGRVVQGTKQGRIINPPTIIEV
jgi:FAD synthase